MSVLTGACACPWLIFPSAFNAFYSLEAIHFRIGEAHAHAMLNLVFFICEGHNSLPSLLVIPCDGRLMGLASFVGGGPPTPFSNYDQELVGGKAHWELSAHVLPPLHTIWSIRGRSKIAPISRSPVNRGL